MEFQYAQIGENPTKEEITRELERLKRLKTDFKNKNEALKIILNSIYGVAGFQHFICYSRDVAESITLQSQDLIQYTIKIYNDFFKEEWHTRTDMHEKMGITKIKQIKVDVIQYADTDSVFAVLGQVMNTTDYGKDITSFVLDLNEHGLQEWIDQKLVDYIDKYHGYQHKMNGAKALVLEMEQICKSILWVAKKKYIKDPIYEDGRRSESLSKVQVKGLALNQSATPKFVRGKLKELVEFIMGSGSNINNNELLSRLRAIKSEFDTVPLEYICKIERISNYEKWILNDTTKLEFMDGAKPHVKGAGYHNFLLKHSEYKNKYQMIRTGTKVHWYYCTSGATGSFSFLTGSVPEEIKPPVNLKMQYEKVLLGPLNNILKAINIPSLNASLILYPAAFDVNNIKPKKKKDDEDKKDQSSDI